MLHMHLETLATELSTRHSLPVHGRRAREAAFEAQRLLARLAELEAELARARRTLAEVERDAREDMEIGFGIRPACGKAA